MMRRIRREFCFPLVALLALGLTACASSGSVAPQAPNEIATGDIAYVVQAGDKLVDISLAATGTSSNWQAIARHNGIDDPKTLAAGASIRIPYALLSAGNIQTLQAKSASRRIAQGTPIPVTTGTGVSVAQTSRANNDEIVVQPVKVNRTFEMQPIEAHSDSPGAELTNPQYDSMSPEIRVIGTYFPKGVYAEPANYAQLIQRVSPGTTFQLQSQVNDWYKVLTDEGIGYIRQSDSVLVQ